MIDIINKEDCSGCSACYNICPKSVISMLVDEEGFEYPNVNQEICIKCELCKKVCPIINSKDKMKVNTEQKAFLVQHKDSDIRIDSTSGGAFTALAQQVIAREGIVFGVALDSKLHAYHTYVTEVKELKRFRNSKYMQSIIGNTFAEVKEFLLQDKLVLFSGTACQIEGLKMYLNKEYDNLITVDVVCRAVPSPMIFDKYMEYQEARFGEKIESIRFRDKFYGYKYSTLNLRTKSNNGNYHHGIESDPWLRAFFSNICDRPSCHKCNFKDQYRVSDITIWDCFSVERFSNSMNDDKGTTRVLTHTQKGQEMIHAIKENSEVIEVQVDILIEGVNELVKSTPSHPRRKEFFNDANKMNGIELFEKYFPNNLKSRVKHSFRVMLNKLGIYSLIKKIVWKLKDKN